MPCWAISRSHSIPASLRWPTGWATTSPSTPSRMVPLPLRRCRSHRRGLGVRRLCCSCCSCATGGEAQRVVPVWLNGLGTNTLTWSISPISLANVSAILAGSGANALKDSTGNGLNGGAWLTQAFKVLWGDYNADGVVNAVDLSSVGALIQRDAPYNFLADMNGDGLVTTADLTIVHNRV